MTSSVDAAGELATFLRTRRERLDPEDFALPSRRAARRTPGLRREEVAELAGVSIDYIVRLEQGRGSHPSPDVVEALAGALRLSASERAYVYDLTRQRPRGSGKAAATAAPELARLVDDLSPLPTMLTNHRADILAWNPEMAALLVDFETLPPEQRNTMWLCLKHPRISTSYVDREHVVRDGIAYLRSAWAAHPDDETLADLIAEFGADAEFARLWAEQDAGVRGRGQKIMRHPDAGLLTLDVEVLTPLQDPDQLLMIHRAADEQSQAALDRLFAA